MTTQVTTATQEGRNLVIRVPGIDDPFVVTPISAKRGQYLTERYLSASLRGIPTDQAEGIFIESFGPENYSRTFGCIVEQVEDSPGVKGWRKRIPADGEIEPEGLALRQEEGETLCMAAFFWNSIIGMEGVNALLDSSTVGTSGILKANGLIQLRLGLSPLTTSRSSVLESLIQPPAGSLSIDPNSVNSSATVRLPANKRSKGQNPAKAKPRKHK